MTVRLAYVVSPHGFGHASRSAAVLNELRAIRPDVEPSVFTTVPEWFWESVLDGPFGYYEALTDVGMVQLSPIEEDPHATLRALEAIRPLETRARELARTIERLDCRLVVCDISPLGLVAARLARLPSVLVESFTWDWIYESYFDSEPGLREVAAEMAVAFDGADVRIQTEPVCRRAAGALAVPPIYRRTRSSAEEVRDRLDLRSRRPLVLITMGRGSWSLDYLERLRAATDLSFVAFAGTPELERHGNVRLLPERSPVSVPDLIAASDVLVGKLGYSSVAEAWAGGTRYAFVPRPAFREGELLAAFVRERLPSLELDGAQFLTGDWLDPVRALLQRPRSERPAENGAETVARVLAARLD